MTGDADVVPELKQIVGAMLFAAQGSVSVGQIRKVFQQVAELHGGPAAGFGKLTEGDLDGAIAELRAALAQHRTGIEITEVANGFKLQNDPACGLWVRQFLERGRPTRLSRPALETLAIIAYRQPCVRSEIEAVRGVQVDQILRNLMEMQLIRIVGRSELPGRPLLLATTEKFLEYFGLKNLDELPGIDELRRRESERLARKEEAAAPEGGAEGEPAGEEAAPAPEAEDDEEWAEDEIEDDDGDENEDEDDEEDEGDEKADEGERDES
ncbi:MAG: SMC-Scp complex subunit ScpB [Kiritimatiellae bacterium]|nr:SMC-Scp complex subunit ScpB [Kiritimatiellia bacterium]